MNLVTPHPSLIGMKAAMTDALYAECDKHGPSIACSTRVAAMFEAQASYLTEHGVGWFGEELVRARPARGVVPPAYHLHRLVPVPRPSEEEE